MVGIRQVLLAGVGVVRVVSEEPWAVVKVLALGWLPPPHNYVLLPVSGPGSWNCSFYGAWGASRGGAGGVVGVAGAAGLGEVGMMLTGVGGVILVGG